MLKQINKKRGWKVIHISKDRISAFLLLLSVYFYNQISDTYKVIVYN